MKSLAACTVVLALAACSSSPGGTTSTTGTSGSGATGGKSTGTTGTASGGHGASSTAAGSSTGSPLGTRCTYNTQTGDDSCTDVGYECTGEFTGAASGTCVLPEDLGICDGDPNASVGCQDGGVPNGEAGGTGDLLCSPPDFQNGTATGFSLCLWPCTTTNDCPDLLQSCYGTTLGGCFNDVCGQDTTGAFVGPFFGTCPVVATDDGQCLSLNGGGFAYCYQNGTADVGEPCNPTYRYGAFSECTFGNICVPSSLTGGDGGLCFPVTDGGCATDADPVSIQTGADWAICAPDCTTSMSCDGGVVGTSCQALTGGATAVSVCLP